MPNPESLVKKSIFPRKFYGGGDMKVLDTFLSQSYSLSESNSSTVKSVMEATGSVTDSRILATVGSKKNYSTERQLQTPTNSEVVISSESMAVAGYVVADAEALLQELREQFVRATHSESFEYGEIVPSQLLLADIAEKYPEKIGQLINYIYAKETGDPVCCIALLNAAGHLKYEKLSFYGVVMALAALSNADQQVREGAIRAFELWEHPAGIDALKSSSTNWEWLEKYRKDTIQYLETLNANVN